jgi:hypothetical protein
MVLYRLQQNFRLIRQPEGSCQFQLKQEGTLIRTRLKTPPIRFSVLLVAGLLVFRLSGRAASLRTEAWIESRDRRPMRA